MKSNLTARGFRWITDFSQLQYGDILLNIQYHTAIYLGNGLLVHASGNEYGEAIGGEPGDQTGSGKSVFAHTSGDFGMVS